MSLEQNFQVNLSGVIRLLSDHLYSGPEVFVRELLQNGVDAITARQHSDVMHDGAIRIEVIGDSATPTISVEDNGVGLTEEEVHQFLATIGKSSKSGDFSRDDFIGQFGIGLLSGFLVSDEITVITQSIKNGSTAIEWIGRADGTYSVRLLQSEFSVGTRVYLRAKAGMAEYFAADRVEDLMRHFGGHLPHRLEYISGEQCIAINEVPLWRQRFNSEANRRQASLEYGKQIFGTDFLDAVPLRSKKGQVEGVAFILPYPASPASRQSHRVYLKNMLLAETVEGLLPDWAFFVKCVVNADRLRPNAARDAFYEDELLQETRSELGRCLKDYLVWLSDNDRPQLDRLIQLHYLPIKALAVEDDDFFRLFIDWLPFETSLGTTTLHDYFQNNSRLRYVRAVDQFRQISGVATAQNICVFNAGYTYDADLLERVAHEFSGRHIEQVDATDLVQNFEELTLAESQQVFELVKIADVVLQKYKCQTEARKFEPIDLPALFTAGESATFLRSVDQSKEQADELWGGILDNVAQAAGAAGYAQFVLNYNNALIRKLTCVKEETLLARIIEILYLQSLLLGHYPLSTNERLILSTGLLGLLDYFIPDREV